MKEQQEYIYKEPEFYYNENRYENTKELFLFLTNIMKKNYDSSNNLIICDHGCAAGELVYHLNKEFNSMKIKGYDVGEKLLEKGRQWVPEVEFINGSVLNPEICEESSADISTCIGVLQIFDTFEEVVDNLMLWTKPGGRVYLHGLFNSFPLDIDVKYNHSKDRDSKIQERGWNIFSKETVSTYLNKIPNVKSHTFHDFEISIDLEKKYDPTHNHIRSWTMKDESGKRMITNGLGLIQPHSILEIEVQK